MTKRAETVEVLSEMRSGYNCFDVDEEPKYHALSMAIEALKAQATLDDVSTAYENGYKQGKFEAQQKTGKWWRRAWSIECSECGYDMPFAIRNYCPNCGAKMEEEQ